MSYPPTHRVWLFTPSKGWGYTFRVPCVVVGSGRARTKVAALTKGGVLKTRHVRDEHLTAPASDSEACICATIQTHLEQPEFRLTGGNP